MSRPLNILHIMRAPVGGLFRHVQDLAIEQGARGHNVGLIADATSGDALTNQRLTDIAPHLSLGIHRIAMSRKPSFGDFACVRETNQLIDKHTVDVVHGHGAKGGLYARLAGTRLSMSGRGGHLTPKRFYTPHGGSLHYTNSFFKGFLYLGIETVLDRLSDGLIFESQFARLAYENALGRPKAATRIIANGLRPTDFEPLSLNDDAAEFLFVGELRDLKGVDVLLRAFAQLDKHMLGPRLVVVGDGTDRASLEDLARRLGILDRVTFTGALPVQSAFPMGKILVMPSRAESLPYIALEAAAAGWPLIATQVGGVPEIVWGTDTELVPPGDVEALRNAMSSAVANFENTSTRADRLRESVKQRFTVASMTASVLAFYDDALRTDVASTGNLR